MFSSKILLVLSLDPSSITIISKFLIKFLIEESLFKISKIVLFGKASDPKLCAPIGKNVMIVKENDIKNIMPKSIKKLINEKNNSKL